LANNEEELAKRIEIGKQVRTIKLGISKFCKDYNKLGLVAKSCKDD